MMLGGPPHFDTYLAKQYAKQIGYVESPTGSYIAQKLLVMETPWYGKGAPEVVSFLHYQS